MYVDEMSKEQEYHIINDEESVVQAKSIEQSLIEPLHGLTIINAETSQPTRQKFITRVYSILWLQLIVTSIFIGCCNQIQPLQTFMMSTIGIYLMWTSIILLLVVTCALHCLRESVRNCPWPLPISKFMAKYHESWAPVLL